MENSNKNNILEKIKNGMLAIQIVHVHTDHRGKDYFNETHIIENCFLDTVINRLDFLYIILNELSHEKLIEVYKWDIDYNYEVTNLEKEAKAEKQGCNKVSRESMISRLLGKQYFNEKLIYEPVDFRRYPFGNADCHNFDIIKHAFSKLDTKRMYSSYGRDKFIDICELKNAGDLFCGFSASFEKKYNTLLIDLNNYQEDFPLSWIENRY